MPDTDAAISWLISWAPAGPWAIGEQDPESENTRLKAKVLSTLDSLRAYITARNGKVNLYFCPNEVLQTITTTPRKHEMRRIVALHVDLDLPKSGPYSTPTKENFTRLLHKIQILSPAPTAIIFSGGGYQCFWLFPTPLPADEHMERVEGVCKTLATVLQSDAVQNANRWMRLPGTTNLLSAKKRARGREPAEAYVVEAEWNRRWDYLTDPIPAFPDDYAAFSEEEEEEGPSDKSSSSSNEGHTVDDLPARWSKIVKSGDASSYRGDRSAMVIAFCFAALRRGWSEKEISTILLSQEYKISTHVLEQNNPTTYAARQIMRARKHISEDWDFVNSGRLDPASPGNIRRALNEMGVKFSRDIFAERSYVNGVGPIREISDEAESEIRIMIYDRYKFYPVIYVQSDVITTLAKSAAFHPVLDYLAALHHDGMARIDTWMIDFLGAEDTPYTRAVSRLILVAAVRRIRHPGSKFDHMVVLVSPQGTGKSSAIAALCPNPSWFTDSMPLRLTDQKAIEHLSGKWIVECSELQGISNSEVETVKAFISRQEDRARPAYGRHPISYARRCILFGTTNAETFLRDTENRRILPIRIQTQSIDVQAIVTIRDQLWAEACVAEKALPHTFDALALPEEFRVEAAEHQERARIQDPWQEILESPLGQYEEGKIASMDLWYLLGVPVERQSPTLGKRVGELMQKLGWWRSYQRINGQGLRCFVHGTKIPSELPTLIAQRDDNFGPYRLVLAPNSSDVFSPDIQSTAAAAYNDDLPF